jgi:predicted transcriptional regulator
MVVNNIDWNSPDGIATARRLFKNAMTDILAIDPNSPPPTLPTPARLKTADDDYYVPALPSTAQLSDKALQASENVASWYYDAVAWTRARSPMTPIHFLQAGVVWVLGLAVARRACIELHERIYPHLYLLLIAETSRYAKSTGLNALRALVIGAMPHMTIPGQTTPEGMMELLAGELPSNFEKLNRRDQAMIQKGRELAAQRGIILDEYSSLLGSYKKDYMQGFIELMMRVYDAQDMEQHYTRTGGMMILKYPGISVLGATTPAAMKRATTEESWENGNYARYLMMFRDKPLDYDPSYIKVAPPQELIRPLTALHDALPRIQTIETLDGDDEPVFQPVTAAMSREAFDQYHAYTKAVFYDMLDDLDDRLHGNYRRLHIQALKMALALAALDWSQRGAKAGDLRVELGHFAIGQTLAELGRDSLHRMMPVLSQSADSRTQRDILSLIMHERDGLTVREIVRRTGKKTREVRMALDVLKESGDIEIVQYSTGGRPLQVYKLLS